MHYINCSFRNALFYSECFSSFSFCACDSRFIDINTKAGTLPSELIPSEDECHVFRITDDKVVMKSNDGLLCLLLILWTSNISMFMLRVNNVSFL